ncbi:hypothetical protein K461DRAFT_168237 [Myriangium duriaei CBS 260.36]|uniref:Uncharacterized protein n=1 Tax=Myriangium duriaei CBS 260.36 TaxID=1168546 RepID=A0A9P4IWC7_9PEZI|nr:hypothetical protein K461DRAFT_168237 [Myriangium duriaei CBS 260.36]
MMTAVLDLLRHAQADYKERRSMQTAHLSSCLVRPHGEPQSLSSSYDCRAVARTSSQTAPLPSRHRLQPVHASTDWTQGSTVAPQLIALNAPLSTAAPKLPILRGRRITCHGNSLCDSGSATARTGHYANQKNKRKDAIGPSPSFRRSKQRLCSRSRKFLRLGRLAVLVTGKGGK